MRSLGYSARLLKFVPPQSQVLQEASLVALAEKYIVRPAVGVCHRKDSCLALVTAAHIISCLFRSQFLDPALTKWRSYLVNG